MARIIALLLALAAPARAEDFSSNSLLLQYSGNLRDPYYGYNATDGAVTVMTFEHYGVWAFGDSFLFLDMISGQLADFNGNDAGTRSRLYAEWQPRLSMSKITGTTLKTGVISDVFIAGQLNRDGEGFIAEMIGASVDITVPGFTFVSLSAYHRKDNFNSSTHQVSVAWGLPFSAGNTSGIFEGYADFAGTDNNGEDINTQPRLLFDIAPVAGIKPGSAMIGLEWYYHKNDWFEQNVPQWTVKWVW